jgi:IS5 family transposase
LAIEPIIGHDKSAQRLDRCWLKGATRDALHAVLCAVGYHLRWLPRPIARLHLNTDFLCGLWTALREANQSLTRSSAADGNTDKRLLA